MIIERTFERARDPLSHFNDFIEQFIAKHGQLKSRFSIRLSKIKLQAISFICVDSGFILFLTSKNKQWQTPVYFLIFQLEEPLKDELSSKYVFSLLFNQ